MCPATCPLPHLLSSLRPLVMVSALDDHGGSPSGPPLASCLRVSWKPISTGVSPLPPSHHRFAHLLSSVSHDTIHSFLSLASLENGFDTKPLNANVSKMKTATASLIGFAAYAAATWGNEDHFTLRPSASKSMPFPTWAPSAPPKWTTSTVYSTTVRTVTSCPPAVPKCPAHSTVVTTVTVAVSTTVCPVTTAPPAPPAPPVASPSPSPSPPVVPSVSWSLPPAPPASVQPPPPPPPVSIQPPPASVVPPSPPPPPALSSVAPPPPPSAPPVVPSVATSVGTISPPVPTKTSPPPAIVTAGAVQNAQLAGGALAAIAIAAALF